MLLQELTAHDVQILTIDQLSKIVDHGDFTDLKKRIKYFDINEGEKETHFCVLDGSKIIGIGGVQVNPYDKDMLWIKHISVDPKYRNKGVAKAIMSKIFSYADHHDKKIKHSSRSDMGKLYLEREAERLAKKYPGIVVEAFGNAYYTVKKTTNGYEVAKFTDDNQPDHVYRVEKRGNHWWTDSPGFIHKAQDEKTIRIVKQYVSDGEPDMVYYSVTDKNIEKRSFK